jgi:hypothetical protein
MQENVAAQRDPELLCQEFVNWMQNHQRMPVAVEGNDNLKTCACLGVRATRKSVLTPSQGG